MKKTFLLFLLFCMTSITNAQFYRLDDVSKTTINDLITDYQNANNIIGISVGVVKDGEIVYLKGSGFADLENGIEANEYTLYRLGSVQKSITGLMAMCLLRDGLLDLNADIREYIPEYPAKPQGIITSEELLSNESGIIHYGGTASGQYCTEDYNTSARDQYIANHLDAYDPIEAIDIFKDQQICFAPGDHYQYTTWGFCLMGAVLERAADKPYEELLYEEINQTLCLPYLQPEFQIYKPYPNEAKGYEFNSNGNIIPTPTSYTDYTDISYKLSAGGSIGSVIDLSLIIKGVVNNELLDEETVDFWGTIHTPEDGEISNYGYGIRSGFRNGSRLYFHSGSQAKTSTLWYFSPDTKNGLIIMANTRGVSLYDLARPIYDYLPNVNIEGDEFQIPEPNIFHIDGGNANCVVSSNEIVDDNTIQLFPNPVKNILKLSLPVNSEIQQVEIINMYGSKTLIKALGQNSIAVDVSNLASGMYGVRFDLNGKKVVRKFIKM